MIANPSRHEEVEWLRTGLVLMTLIAIAVTYLALALAPQHGGNENVEVLHNLVWPH